MDADCYAMGFLFQGVLDAGHGLTPSDRSFEQRIPAWLTGVFVLFRSFDRRLIGQAEILSGDHPPGAMRTLMLYSLMVELWDRHVGSEKWFKVDAPFPMERIANLLRAIERAIDEASGVEGRNGNLKAATAALLDGEYTATLLHRWARIRPDLDRVKHASGQLAPAQREPR